MNVERIRPEETEESPEKNKEIRINKKTLVFVMGLSGSGKSTFALNNFPLDSIVSTDRIRGELTNNPRNQLISEKAFLLAARLVEERLKNGELAVVDAQNLKEGDRDRFYKAAEKHGAHVSAIFLEVSPEEAMKREAERKKKVGTEYIKSRSASYRTALHSLQKSRHVDQIHVVKAEDTNKILVKLPPEDEARREADREFRREAKTSEFLLGAAEVELRLKESPEYGEALELKAGSAVFLPTTDPKTHEFISKNFLPHQVIDVQKITRRLHTEIDDEAVRDVTRFILKERAYLNLTTVVSYPAAFRFRKDLEQTLKELGEHKKVEIPTIYLSEKDLTRYQRVTLRHDAPPDTPLFLIGDVQGCYQAMRELASRVRQENIAKRKGLQVGPERKIVFVGDMADRGPYDAEAVIYITALVRAGRAILVKGNHDENLLKGLRGETLKSSETQKTLEALQHRLKKRSLQKIIDVLEQAPLYAKWQHLVAVHASLLRIPREGEIISDSLKHAMTHGARSGRWVGGRSEVWKLANTLAKDPDILAVGGHTHEEEPLMDLISGSTVLDVSAEVKGRLWGMYYPELEFASAEEPTVVKLYKALEGKNLPQGEELLTFLEYAREQGFIDVKHGQGEYEGLLLSTYSEIAELSNLWELYPVLRHFRGLIIDARGNIVARPFQKTHKAGDEISLEKLNIIPDKVFEKANGSLGIVYFWNGQWRVATKFSFENEEYTKPALDMLGQMSLASLDPTRTYLFEIILPNDSHIVDYGGRRELVLLNSVSTVSGQADPWQDVLTKARDLGARTAEDLTERFRSMTIADIYRYAQTEGNLSSMEGLMAEYRNQSGEKVLVKIKTKEYDDKKFVRDRLNWDDIFKAFDPKTMEVPPEKFEELLGYNFDNQFARSALAMRMAWIKEEYHKIVEELHAFLFAPLSEAEQILQKHFAQGRDKYKALELTLKEIAPVITKLLESKEGTATKENMRTSMGFIRGLLAAEERPQDRIASYALARIKTQIEAEKKKRGKNSFWVVPE